MTDLGLVSTDALYFAVGKFGFPAGVMITASHNPPEYNGFKICREEARAVSFEDGIKQIRDRAHRERLSRPLAGPARRSAEQGRARGVRRARPQPDRHHGKLKPLKIAIDAGNGMAGKTVPLVFDNRLPVEIVPLYFELDGTFPNHLANPIEPENVRDLQQAVLDNGCDLRHRLRWRRRPDVPDRRAGRAVGGDMVTAMVAIALARASIRARPFATT